MDTYGGTRIDVTRFGADPTELITRFLHQEAIVPEQIGAYKVILHRQCVQEWVRNNPETVNGQSFFAVMNEILRRNLPLERDEAMLGWFREIDLHPSRRCDAEKLDPAARRGLNRAAKTAHTLVTARTRGFAGVVKGWVEALLPADFGTDDVNHAAVAILGLL